MLGKDITHSKPKIKIINYVQLGPLVYSVHIGKFWFSPIHQAALVLEMIVIRFGSYKVWLRDHC